MVSRYMKYKRGYESYRKKNKNKIKLIARKYRRANKEKISLRNKLERDETMFDGQREIVLERDDWKCIKCGMTQEQHIILFNRSLTVDHIDGKGRYSKEKNNSLNNLQTLCLRCHGRKDILRHSQFKKRKGK